MDIERLEKLYKTARTLYIEAGKSIQNEESDSSVFDKADSCSNKLYTAVEYTVKVIANKYIANFDFEQPTNLAALCNDIARFIPEDSKIDLNTLVIEKEARNLLTHSARLSRINNFARVFMNLRRLIWFISPSSNLEGIENLREDALESKKITSFLDFNNYQENAHVLITDSLDDMDKDFLNLIANAQWDTIYDFGVSSDYKGLRGSRDIVNNKTLFLNLEDIHNLSDHYITRDKIKWLNMNPEDDAIPKKYTKWQKDKKSLEKYIAKSYSLFPYEVTIISLKRYNPVVEMIIDYYLLYFESVKVVLLNEFDEELSKTINDRYDKETLNVFFASLHSISEIVIKHKRIFNIDKKLNVEYSLPSRDGNDYFASMAPSIRILAPVIRR